MRDRRKMDPVAVSVSEIATMEAIERNMKGLSKQSKEYRALEDEWIASLRRYEMAEKAKSSATLDKT